MGVVVMLQSDIKPHPQFTQRPKMLYPYSGHWHRHSNIHSDDKTFHHRIPVSSSALSPSFDNLASFPRPSHHSFTDKFFDDQVV